VGFEPTIPVLEQAKTVHASDRVALVSGSNPHDNLKKSGIIETKNVDLKTRKVLILTEFNNNGNVISFTLYRSCRTEN
jgi:hypothetical protein